MPNYFARVELHEAKWPEDYEKLHELLAEVGFSPCLHYTKGGSAKLPTGFYYGKNLGKNVVSVSQTVFNAADLSGFETEV
jgi:hypothetical protein